MNKNDIGIIISGAAGQGLQTVGYVLAKALSRSGYEVFAWQEYESRIRGGSNSYMIRVGEKIAAAPIEHFSIFLPLDAKSRAKYLPLLEDDGVLIEEREAAGREREAAEGGPAVVTVPFQQIAEQQLGNKLYANTVAVGALAGILGMDLTVVNNILTEEFGRKGAEVTAANIAAAKAGYDLATAQTSAAQRWQLPSTSTSGAKYFISGNETLALGAAAAGCNFMSAYPMTPSTGIITFLSAYSRKLGVLTEQAEDEIAAINMAIGASYAGARAMTATSGGGFCLMTEGVSLAGMTETPVVIVLGQRPGPATGLPTRTEQGDLLFAINAGHGEFPKAVLAPADARDAFYKAARAFTLAEKYQIPVIVMTDQYLADAYSTIDLDPDLLLQAAAGAAQAVDGAAQAVEGAGGGDDQLAGNAGAGDGAEYYRYALTDSGISPRRFPGQGPQLVCCDSDEHDESGHITEDLQLRQKMVEKRMHKLEALRQEIAPPEAHLVEDAEIVLLSWGSSRSAVFEAVARLRAAGHKVGALHFTELWPLPDYTFAEGVRYYTVESNAGGQLARLLRGEYALRLAGSICRYDGLPLTSSYIVQSPVMTAALGNGGGMRHAQ